jgi:hypothetical protein
MYQAADNEFLADVLNALYALSLRLWYFALTEIGDMHDTVIEHQMILEALRPATAIGRQRCSPIISTPSRKKSSQPWSAARRRGARRGTATMALHNAPA